MAVILEIIRLLYNLYKIGYGSFFNYVFCMASPAPLYQSDFIFDSRPSIT